MERKEVIERLKRIAGHAVIAVGAEPYILSLDDGIAVHEAIDMLKEQEQEAKWIYGEDETGVDGWHCSECNFFEPWFYDFTDDIDFIRFYKHCPDCGRKMTSYTGKPTKFGTLGAVLS